MKISFNHIQRTIKAIRKRITSRISLAQQIEQFAKKMVVYNGPSKLDMPNKVHLLMHVINMSWFLSGLKCLINLVTNILRVQLFSNTLEYEKVPYAIRLFFFTSNKSGNTSCSYIECYDSLTDPNFSNPYLDLLQPVVVE